MAKTIKIIDLLNKISNGEDIPKKIKWGVHELDFSIYDYKAKGELGNPSFTGLLENVFNEHTLNEQIEILEEEPRDIEVCGSLFTKSEYDKLAHREDEKKIPEKLKDVIEDGCIKAVNNFELMDKINEILDYLETKGE